MELPNSRMAMRRQELFDDIDKHISQLLRDMGIVSDIADQASTAVADFLAQHWEGQNMTIPKDFRYKVAMRDLEIYRSHYRSHKGDFFLTARQWGMSDRGVRKVIGRVTRRIMAQTQGRLFDEVQGGPVNRRNELFEDLDKHISELLRDIGIADDLADQASTAVADFLAEQWGGQNMVIPKDFRYKVAMRDLEIYRSHGGDVAVTAKQWGMTERGVKRVIDRVDRRIVAQGQGKLPDEVQGDLLSL